MSDAKMSEVLAPLPYLLPNVPHYGRGQSMKWRANRPHGNMCLTVLQTYKAPDSTGGIWRYG